MPVHGRKTRVLCNAFDLSSYFKNADANGEAALIDATVFTSPSKEFLPDYIEGMLSLSGVFAADQFHAVNNPGGLNNKVDDVLQPILGVDTDQLFLVGQEGYATEGLNVQLLQGKETKYSIQSPTNNLVSVAAEVKSNGPISSGILLSPLTAKTVTGNSSAQDGGAATTFGAYAHLHCTAKSGTSTPTLTVIIEDSADGASGWATIGSFTLLSNVTGSQRISIAGTVRRYTRASWTITGTTPSFTFAVGFARRFSA